MAVYSNISSVGASIANSVRKATRNVDIYIREKNGSREIRIPWLPEEIEYRSGGIKAVAYDIMNKGTIEIPTGTGLKEVSWNSVFPGIGRTDDSMLRGSWQNPSYYHNILEDWRTKGTPLTIMVTGYPINFDAHLKDYTAKPAGGFGDMEYELELIEDRNLTITSSTTTAGSSSTTQTLKRPTTTQTSYTIKSGDTLWSIAQKQLGAGSKWQTIYSANKEIIESTAKKHGKSSSNNGWWIFPGVTIQIPQ